MSNIHILNKDNKNKTVQCIFHITTPTGNNAVGIPWSTAIKNHFQPTPLMNYGEAVEKESIEYGMTIETKKLVRFSSTNLTNAQRLTEIQEVYNTMSVTILQKFKDELNFFGKEI